LILTAILARQMLIAQSSIFFVQKLNKLKEKQRKGQNFRPYAYERFTAQR
jgi:hypothetical protein